MFLILLLSLVPNAEANFSGTWSGTGTFYSGEWASDCSKVELAIEQTESRLFVKGGSVDCEHDENDFQWQPVSLEISKGILYFNNFIDGVQQKIPAGKIDLSGDELEELELPLLVAGEDHTSKTTLIFYKKTNGLSLSNVVTVRGSEGVSSYGISGELTKKSAEQTHSSLETETLDPAPFRNVVSQNLNQLKVHYSYTEGDNGDGQRSDPCHTDGLSYTDALKNVETYYKGKTPTWKCGVYPKGTSGRFCRQTFHGGNFDSVNYFDFTFYFIQDAQGIRLKTNTVDSLFSVD